MDPFVFPTAGAELLQAQLDWVNDDIRACLLISGAVVDADTMTYLADISADARIVTSATLTGRTTTGGKANSHAAYFADFVDVDQRLVDRVVLYLHNADPAAALLIAYYEGAAGFPFYGAGRNYYVAPTGGYWFKP